MTHLGGGGGEEGGGRGGGGKAGGQGAWSELEVSKTHLGLEC